MLRGAAPAAALFALGALAAGACASSTTFQLPAPLRSAPEPAVSPPPPAPPAGKLIGVGLQPEGIAVSATGTIIVSVRGAHPGLDLLDGLGQTVPPGFVALPGEARHLSLAGPDGPVLVPVESVDRLVVVSLPQGEVTGEYPVGRQPHDAAPVEGGYAVGDELASTVHVVRPGGTAVVEPAPLQPGGIASTGADFVVVGVRGRVIAAYSAGGRLIARAACGVGPTHVVAGPGGLLFVADTNGGAVLVFRLHGTTLSQVASIPAGPEPYGMAADPARGWVFVTLTGDDRLLGLRFDGTHVVQRVMWPTGRQPNTVAFDGRDNLLAVTATATDQVELIPAPSLGVHAAG